jgi:hypothetical protein
MGRFKSAKQAQIFLAAMTRLPRSFALNATACLQSLTVTPGLMLSAFGRHDQ